MKDFPWGALVHAMETSDEAATAAASLTSSIVMTSDSAAGSSSSATADSATATSLSLNLPPGYRFSPTNAELVVHFLRPKLAGGKLPLPIFFDERVLDYHPEQLIEKYREHGEDRWFFFTWRERKYAGGKRPNRTTLGNGHWNATGSLRPIYADGALVGCVGTQVFYEASRKKKKGDVAAAADTDDDNGKTDWTMYEYENLTSEAEFQAMRNGEAKIDELVLCTIQKKKHCKQNKKNKRKEEDQEDTPCTGNIEKKSRTQDSHVGGKSGSDKKSSRVGGKSEKKGNPAVGTKRRRKSKEVAQEQEAYVKRSPMATQQQQEQMEAPLGQEFINTDPNMNMSHRSATMPMSYQEMLLLPDAGTQSNNVHPNNSVMHRNFIHPMEFSMLQGPPLQEHFPYEHPFFYPQHVQLNTLVPPEVYTPGLGPEYPNYGSSSWKWDQHDHLSSYQSPPQPSYGAGGSTSTQGMVTRSPGGSCSDMKPLGSSVGLH